MAGKTIIVLVDLPPNEYAFINGKRAYGGSEIKIDESQLDPKSKWMKRKQVETQKAATTKAKPLKK